MILKNRMNYDCRKTYDHESMTTFIESAAIDVCMAASTCRSPKRWVTNSFNGYCLTYPETIHDRQGIGESNSGREIAPASGRESPRNVRISREHPARGGGTHTNRLVRFRLIFDGCAPCQVVYSVVNDLIRMQKGALHRIRGQNFRILLQTDWAIAITEASHVDRKRSVALATSEWRTLAHRLVE